MDKVIDKLILEWSWRCEKGYPDINNPADKKVLDKLLAEYGVSPGKFITEQEDEKSDIKVEDIISLLKAKDTELNDSQKLKIFKIVEKSGKGLSSSLYESLIQKNLVEQQASVIVGYADRVNIEDKILKTLENPDNTFSKLGNQGNLIKILEELTGISGEYIDTLVRFTVAKTKSIGRGELALISLLYDTFAASKGDIQLKDKTLIEVKATGESGAIVAPDTISRGDSKSVIAKIIDIFGEKFPEMKNIGKVSGRWPDRLQNQYNTLDSEDEKKIFVELIRRLTTTMYDKFVPTENINTYSSTEYKELVSKSLAKAYVKDKKVLFISPTNNFILLDGKSVVDHIGETLKISGFSDSLPRIEYNN